MLITCSFGTRNTGADVRYQILNADKSVWVSRRSTGVTELLAGSGVFGVEVGDTILAGRTVVWDIDGTDKSAGDSFPTPPIVDVGEIDWSALWGTMPTGINIQVISPVYLGGDVTIVAGDDYKAADNRALSWVDKSNIWPDLSGATFKLTISHQAKVV